MKRIAGYSTPIENLYYLYLYSNDLLETEIAIIIPTQDNLEI